MDQAAQPQADTPQAPVAQAPEETFTFDDGEVGSGQQSEQPASGLAPDSQRADDNSASQSAEIAPEVAPDSPEGFKKVINKKHFELKEAERRAEALQEQLDAIQAQQAPQLPEQRPEILPVRSPADFDTDEQYLEYDKQRIESVQAQVAYDNAVTQQQNAQQAQQQAAIEQQIQEAKQRSDKFEERAGTLNVTPEVLQASVAAIGHYNIGQEKANFILDHEQGPVIAEFLASNPEVLGKIQSATPMQAAVLINGSVAEAAAAMKKTSSAPAPAQVTEGIAVSTGEATGDPDMDGYTIE